MSDQEDWGVNDPVVNASANALALKSPLPPTPEDEWGTNDSIVGQHSPPRAGETSQPMGWGDAAKTAVGNIPSSAATLAQNIVTPFLHPVDTAKGLYDIGSGLVSKAAGAVGVQQDPQQKAEREASADAVGQFFADRYGGVDAFKNTLAHDPVGLIADLAAVLTGGSALAARAPGAVGSAARVVGKAGSKLDPVLAAGKLAGKGAAAGLHLVTGLGDNVLETAAKAGATGNRAFLDNMRAEVPPTDVIDLAKSALDKMRAERSAAYKAGMVGVNSDPTVLSFTPIQQALQDAASKVTYRGLVKSEDAASVLKQIQDKVDQWQAQPVQVSQTPNGLVQVAPHRTAEGLDALKQAIGEIRQSTQPGTLSRNVADSVYNAAKASIVKQAPEYANTMLGYSEASEKLNELMKTFSLGEKASPDTSLRKLQSVTRNNVNTNYGARTRLMDDLAKYEPDLPPALAGQATSTMLPRGLARAGAHVGLHALAAYMNPATLPLLIASSPRVAGETAYALGNAFGKVKRGAGAVGVKGKHINPGLRSALQAGRAAGIAATAEPTISGIVGGIGPRYDEYGNLLSAE